MSGYFANRMHNCFDSMVYRNICGVKKINANFLFVQSFSTSLRVMDVRAENRGRPQPKVRFPVAPVVGRNSLTPGHRRKGQECPREIRTKKFCLGPNFRLFFLPYNSILSLHTL